MKIQSKRKKIQANKVFTDREEPRASFWKNYRQYKETMQAEGEVKVLAYYGIGGIGKTTLLHKLQEEMRENINDLRYLYFDFNIAQDARTVLDYLKTKLSNDYGYTFPLYELGVYAYAQKIGEDMASPEIKGFIEKSPLLNFAVTVAGALPVAGVVSNIIKATDKGIAYLRTVISKHSHEISDIENKTPEEVYEYLPYLFAQDMADLLKDNTEPMVVFLDTYERLVNEMSSVGEPLNNDLWLRGEDGLIQNIPNVLWVIAGRERLKWERFDTEWKEALEQHLLGNLSRADADSFMKYAGIGDEALREGLYGLTQGTPVYLDVCVDSYTSLVEQGKTPKLSDFGKNVYTLIERFARYMDDSRKDIVYMLSCMNIWNDKMLTDLGSKIIPGFSLTTYERVKEFSFVTRSDEHNYNIHQTVGETLFANCPKVIRESAVRHAVPYCEERLRESGTFDQAYAYHLQWLVRFGLQSYENDDELIVFYNEHLRQYLKRLAVSGQAPLAEHIFEPVMARANKRGKSLLKALALSESSFLKQRKGEYAASVALAEEAVLLHEELLGGRNELTLKARHRLGEHLRSNGEYQRSYDVLNDVLSIRRSLSMPLDEEELGIRDAIAETMSSLGKYKEALPLQEQVLVLHKEILGGKHPNTINAMNNLACLISDLGRYEDALPLREQVLALCKEILGDKHPDTISAMGNLAYTFSDLGRYEDARSLQEQVLSLSKEILGDKHPETMIAMNNLACLFSDLGRYEDALALNEQVLALRKGILGERHPSTITAMNNLASSFSDLGRHKEALQLREQVLVLRKEILGDKHPKTIDAMHNLARLFSNLGRYEDARSLQEQVLALSKEILGEKHPETIRVMAGLASRYFLCKMFQKGLPYAEKAVKLMEETDGINERSRINILGTLALLYSETGSVDKALVIAENNLETTIASDSFDKGYLASGHYVMAYCLNKAQRFEEAFPHAEQAFAIRNEQSGDSDNDTIRAKELLEEIKHHL